MHDGKENGPSTGKARSGSRGLSKHDMNKPTPALSAKAAVATMEREIFEKHESIEKLFLLGDLTEDLHK
jgi:hypothetical protein